ncbi:MAG: hypothetical protein J0I65_09825 [Variovorax sp.]|nr:hypothetical protein [Variovorax sp.]|tara:strand:+ start:797 stop:1090 length:294 start_codon:yes stop_codon:yes gene_type:complete
MLNVTAARFDGVMGRLQDLADPELQDLTDAQLYELLDNAIYRDDHTTPAQVAADAERFFKFDFLTNGGESFDRQPLNKLTLALRSNDLRPTPSLRTK